MNVISKILKGDKVIWIVALILGVISLIVVYSATSALAVSKYDGNTGRVVMKHLGMLLFGFLMMVLGSRINYKRYAKIAGFSSARDTTGDRNNSWRLSEEALTKAISNVLEEGAVKASDVKCIYGFGNGVSELDNFEMDVYKKIFGDNIEVKLVKKDFGEARAASSSLQFAMLAKDIFEGKCENGIAVSYGTSSLYSAVLLTKA